MNPFKSIPLILLIFVSCKNDFYNDDSLHLVLSDFDRHSYYIGLTVKSGASTSTFIIDNTSLYRYYEEKDGFTKNQYESFIKSKIRRNSILEIDSSDLGNFGFHRVDPSHTIADDIAADTSIILSKYFERPNGIYVVDSAVNVDHWNEIAFLLFKKGVLQKQVMNRGCYMCQTNSLGSDEYTERS